MLLIDFDDLDENGNKGDWCFIRSKKFICIRYGDGGLFETVVLPIHKIGTTGKEPADWEWNGDENSPTLSPSILVHENPGWTNGWHGVLRDGKLIDA